MTRHFPPFASRRGLAAHVRRALRAMVRFSLLALLVPCSSLAQSASDDVRDAENGFAKAFADRNVERFASFIARDATFIVRGKPVRGRDAVVKSWGDLLSSETPPFSWKQEQVYVDDAEKSAMSIGGVFDPEGNRIATFTSYWRNEPVGWQVAFDGPGAPVCPQPK